MTPHPHFANLRDGGNLPPDDLAQARKALTILCRALELTLAGIGAVFVAGQVAKAAGWLL